MNEIKTWKKATLELVAKLNEMWEMANVDVLDLVGCERVFDKQLDYLFYKFKNAAMVEEDSIKYDVIIIDLGNGDKIMFNINSRQWCLYGGGWRNNDG